MTLKKIDSLERWIEVLESAKTCLIPSDSRPDKFPLAKKEFEAKVVDYYEASDQRKGYIRMIKDDSYAIMDFVSINDITLQDLEFLAELYNKELLVPIKIGKKFANHWYQAIWYQPESPPSFVGSVNIGEFASFTSIKNYLQRR